LLAVPPSTVILDEDRKQAFLMVGNHSAGKCHLKAKIFACMEVKLYGIGRKELSRHDIFDLLSRKGDFLQAAYGDIGLGAVALVRKGYVGHSRLCMDCLTFADSCAVDHPAVADQVFVSHRAVGIGAVENVRKEEGIVVFPRNRYFIEHAARPNFSVLHGEKVLIAASCVRVGTILFEVFHCSCLPVETVHSLYHIAKKYSMDFCNIL